MTARRLIFMGGAAATALVAGVLQAQAPPTRTGEPIPTVLAPTAQQRQEAAVARRQAAAPPPNLAAGRAAAPPAFRYPETVAAIGASPVPVLLPRFSPGLSTAQVFVRGDTYAAGLDEGDRGVSVFGTRQAFIDPKMAAAPPPAPSPAAPGPAAARAALGGLLAKAPPNLRAQLGLKAQPGPAPPPVAPQGPTNVRYQRTESGVDISFMRFGAVYDVSLTCASPDTDPKCSDAAAKAVLDSLVVAGGGAGW